ncbi:MAG: GPW/gp25 family protein [Chlorobiaceae bacterium]|nr:GPW/gp25 family protein [Chlorobiaceae bacterium]
MSSEQAFLGRGWGFPPEFTRPSKSVGMLEDEHDIESSLEILLSTRLGERVMQPNYGCNMDEMVFESMNLTMLTYLKDLVENAILYFENRIELEGLDIDTSQDSEGLLLITIDYRVRSTNSRFNYVYPFYKNEGTNLLSSK